MLLPHLFFPLPNLSIEKTRLFSHCFLLGSYSPLTDDFQLIFWHIRTLSWSVRHCLWFPLLYLLGSLKKSLLGFTVPLYFSLILLPPLLSFVLFSIIGWFPSVLTTAICLSTNLSSTELLKTLLKDKFCDVASLECLSG